MSVVNHSPNIYSKDIKIAVIGAGNCGQALAGTLASQGYKVCLYNRNIDKLSRISERLVINYYGAKKGQGKLTCLTDKIDKAIYKAKIIFITTTANAHKDIALLIAAHLQDDQIVVLCPGRTGGVLEFREVLESINCSRRVYIAESDSFIYACRANYPGRVKIIGEKMHVSLASYPAKDINYIFNSLKSIHPSFKAVENVLLTGFQNIGAVFHPAVMLLNAASIERGTKFFFYNDMTPSVADIIHRIDQERMDLGNSYNIKLLSVMEWLKEAYPQTFHKSLYEVMKNNPAYHEIFAPESLQSRYLLEDIPTGLVPFVGFGEIAGLNMPLCRSIVHISSALLRRNFIDEGRTLDKLGFAGKDVNEILKKVNE